MNSSASINREGGESVVNRYRITYVHNGKSISAYRYHRSAWQAIYKYAQQYHWDLRIDYIDGDHKCLGQDWSEFSMCTMDGEKVHIRAELCHKLCPELKEKPVIK